MTVTRRRYTKRQKATSVIAAEMASVAAAAEATGVPRKTLEYWMDDPQFAYLRQKTREDMAAESSLLAHRTLEAIQARLTEFEPRDLTILYGVLVDKGQLLAGQATSRSETRDLTGTFEDGEWEKLKDVLREAANVGV